MSLWRTIPIQAAVPEVNTEYIPQLFSETRSVTEPDACGFGRLDGYLDLCLCSQLMKLQNFFYFYMDVENQTQVLMLVDRAFYQWD